MLADFRGAKAGVVICRKPCVAFSKIKLRTRVERKKMPELKSFKFALIGGRRWNAKNVSTEVIQVRALGGITRDRAS